MSILSLGIYEIHEKLALLQIAQERGGIEIEVIDEFSNFSPPPNQKLFCFSDFDVIEVRKSKNFRGKYGVVRAACGDKIVAELPDEMDNPVVIFHAAQVESF
jgi:hypothetical protein